MYMSCGCCPSRKLEALFERMAADDEGHKQISLAEFLRVFAPSLPPMSAATSSTLHKKPMLFIADASSGGGGGGEMSAPLP